MSNLIHHKMHFKTARENLQIALTSESSIRNLMTDNTPWIKQDLIDQNYSKFSESVITSIIFSGLTVESFINYYGISRLSKSQFDNYLDRLDLLSKWVVIPKFVTGTAIDTGSQAIQLLKQLIRSRNKLVHYKASSNSPQEFYTFLSSLNHDPKIRLPWIEDAEIGVQAVHKLLEEIVKIDTSISKEEIEWEEEKDHWFRLWAI